MQRGLAYIDSMPLQARTDARRYAEHLTLRPNGTAGLVMRLLLSAPEKEFSMSELVRRTRAARNNVTSAFSRLELLGFLTIRHDHDAPTLQGGGAPRWLRITEQGRAAAIREGLTSAPPEYRAGPHDGPHIPQGEQ